MSVEAVQIEILDRMKGIFQPPQGSDAAAERRAQAEYVDALKSFEPHTLRKAWETVRDAHKGLTRPSIAEFKSAAIEAIRSTQPTGGKAKDRETQERDARWELWKATRITETARQAAREGWAWSLKSYVLDNGKLPVGTPLFNMRAWAFNRNERIEKCLAELKDEWPDKARDGFAKIAETERMTKEEIETACRFATSQQPAKQLELT